MLNRFTRPSVPVFAVAVLLPLSALTAAQTAPSVIDAVQKAAPQRIDGPIPAHVSGGAEQRAKELVRLEKIRPGFQAWATSLEAPIR